MAAILAIAATAAAPAQTLTNPSYSAQSVVHAATQTAQALAPNTIATIYGTNLSFDTVAAGTSTVTDSTLPQSLDGVTVVVEGITANLFFVSPTQINFLIPYLLAPGTVSLFVAHDSLAGPLVQLQLNSTAPGLFVYNGFILATHLNGSLISAAAPARPGEIIVVYVAGLGWTSPNTDAGRLVTSAASIVLAAQTQVLLDGTACPQSSLLYVGLAPGFAGLYQINMIVPPMTPVNPELRVQVGAQISPPGTLLALQPQ
jgi:uncharacterized protein (TIGR03437 family)